MDGLSIVAETEVSNQPWVIGSPWLAGEKDFNQERTHETQKKESAYVTLRLDCSLRPLRLKSVRVLIVVRGLGKVPQTVAGTQARWAKRKGTGTEYALL
jgi:hypothetical protein